MVYPESDFLASSRSLFLIVIFFAQQLPRDEKVGESKPGKRARGGFRIENSARKVGKRQRREENCLLMMSQRANDDDGVREDGTSEPNSRPRPLSRFRLPRKWLREVFQDLRGEGKTKMQER